MKLGIKNKIDKAVEGASEKAGQVKRGASDGFNKASELAKDFADKAGSVAKDVVSKANSGVNSGVEAVGEKIQSKKSVLKAAEEIDSVVKSYDKAISPNMEEYLSNQLKLLSVELKDLSKAIRKNEPNVMARIEKAKAKMEIEKRNFLNAAINDFTRSQLIKHYTKAINACEMASELLRETLNPEE